jgi:hypothetical protein
MWTGLRKAESTAKGPRWHGDVLLAAFKGKASKGMRGVSGKASTRIVKASWTEVGNEANPRPDSGCNKPERLIAE